MLGYLISILGPAYGHGKVMWISMRAFTPCSPTVRSQPHCRPKSTCVNTRISASITGLMQRNRTASSFSVPGFCQKRPRGVRKKRGRNPTCRAPLVSLERKKLPATPSAASIVPASSAIIAVRHWFGLIHGQCPSF